MNLHISKTQKGIKEFPIHKHSEFEIAFYPGTTGVLKTPEKVYNFNPGDTVIVPPGILHGAYSQTELNAIYLKGDFNLLFHLKTPVVVPDTRNIEARLLTSLLYNNRFGNKEYLLSLCDAFLHFLATNIDFEDEAEKAVNEIIEHFTQQAFDTDITPSEILKNSGYAEDYVRSKFKKITGKTPTEFLTDIRIDHARFLMEAYGNSLPLSEIAEICGYTDYVYFSKRFKAVVGMSPREYRGKV